MAYGNREWYMRNWEWCVENQESFMGIGMHGNWNGVSGIGNGVYGKSGIIFGIEMNSNREWCK